MPQRKAVIVALDEYPNPANNLPSCVADAEAFEDLLRRTYEFTDIQSLYNDRATLESVENGIAWLFDGAAADDSLVFFFSGHGYQAQRGENLEEVLCCYDRFLFDDILSKGSQKLPPGVLTCIFDSCHSGGMYKLVVFDAKAEIAQTKVLKVPPPAEVEKVFLAKGQVGRLSYKPFGAPAADPSAIAKRLELDAVPKGIGDEAGDLEMNGLLLSASLENETASASTSRTEGKSAFTFALLQQLVEFGPNVPSRVLRDGVEAKLRELGFRQTPVMMESPQPGGLANRPFLLLKNAAAPPVGAAEALNPEKIARRLIELTGSDTEDEGPQKEYTMPEHTTMDQPMPIDEKTYDAAAPIASDVALSIYQDLQEVGIQPQKDFAATPAGEEKFWNFVAQAAVAVAPYVINELTKAGYAPEKDLDGEEKSVWNAARRGLMAVLPVLHREITEEGLEPEKDLDAAEKGWGWVGRLAATGLRIAVETLSNQGAAPKGFDVAAEEKGWWDKLTPILSTVGGALLQRLSKSGIDPQRDFAGVEDKMWGGLITGVFGAARSIYERIRNKQFDIAKDFDGEQKFWGALAAGLQVALPFVGSLVKGELEKAHEVGEAEMPKGVETTMPNGEAEEKVLGILSRVIPAAIGTLTTAVPTAAERMTSAAARELTTIVRDRRRRRTVVPARR